MILYKKLTVHYADQLQYQMQKAFPMLLQCKLRTNQSIPDLKQKTLKELSLNDTPIYSHVDDDIFQQHVPLMHQFLLDNKLKIKIITMLVIGKQLSIHCDLSQQHLSYKEFLDNPPLIKSAIIFPVYNTEHSSTIYYKPKHMPEYYVGIEGRVLSFEADDMEKVDEFTVDSIYAMRVDIPHGVYNYSDKPRVVYSIKFTENVL